MWRGGGGDVGGHLCGEREVERYIGGRGGRERYGGRSCRKPSMRWRGI